MFGDFIRTADLQIDTGFDVVSGRVGLWGGNHSKVADNNLAIPQDRWIGSYNRFGNALDLARRPAAGQPIGAVASEATDRYTVGFERTFHCGQSSVEMRLPLLGGGNDYESGDLLFDGSEIGNLSLILKHLVRSDVDRAFSIGLGIQVPTAANFQADLPLQNLTIEGANRSTHLLPFLAWLHHPSDALFSHTFLQLDVPLRDNRLTARDLGAGASEAFDLSERTVLFVDWTLGTWLVRNHHPCKPSVAGLVELHYATALSDHELVASTLAPVFVGNGDSFDVLNLTIGFHFDLHRGYQFRAGAAFPLLNEDQRFFDSEIILAFIRRFS